MRSEKESLRWLRFKSDKPKKGYLTREEVELFRRSLRIGQRLKVQVRVVLTDEDGFGYYAERLEKRRIVAFYPHLVEFEGSGRTTMRPTARYEDLIIWNGGRNDE